MDDYSSKTCGQCFYWKKDKLILVTDSGKCKNTETMHYIFNVPVEAKKHACEYFEYSKN